MAKLMVFGMNLSVVAFGVPALSARLHYRQTTDVKRSSLTADGKQSTPNLMACLAGSLQTPFGLP